MKGITNQKGKNTRVSGNAVYTVFVLILFAISKGRVPKKTAQLL